MSKSFEVIAVTMTSERTVYCSPSKEDACKISMGFNKKSQGVLFIVECLDGSRMTIVEQRRYLRDEEDYWKRNDPFWEHEYYNDHPRKVNK